MDSEHDLNSLPLFLALAEAGSFTAAADRLGCNKSKVSLAIKRLEARLGVTLVTRTTRQVKLTDAGERLRDGLGPLLADMDVLLNGLEGDQQILQGELCITAPEDFAAQVLAPAVIDFQQQHPALAVELRSGDRVSDMVREGIDLTIRLGWLRDSSLRATRLGTFQQYLVASPALLTQYGMPSHPEQLAAYPWIAFSPLPSPLTWTFSHGQQRCQVRMRGAITANSTTVTKQLLLGGAGVSVLTDSSVEAELQSGALIRLLPEWQLPEGGIHAVFPPGAHSPAKVRKLVSFLRERLGNER